MPSAEDEVHYKGEEEDFVAQEHGTATCARKYKNKK
jgi:hypothetical protein